MGIYRTIHKKLIERLMQLSDSKETSQWKSVLEELQRAYEETMQILRLAELTAMTYNEIQTSVRIKVAIELRNRKRKERFINEDEL